MVKYALKENKLGEDSKGCLAVVSALGVATIDDVIGHMIAEGTGLTRPQAMAYFEKLSQSISRYRRFNRMIIFLLSNPITTAGRA